MSKAICPFNIFKVGGIKKNVVLRSDLEKYQQIRIFKYAKGQVVCFT